MTPSRMLRATSLLSILLFSIHASDDVVRGMASGGLNNLVAVLVLIVWLYGTMVLLDRPIGLVIVLLGSLVAASVPAMHMRGAGVGGSFVTSAGAFWFIWTLFAIGATGAFSAILAVRALIDLRMGPSRQT